MARLLKIILSIIATIVLLVVIAIAVLPHVISPNDFKPEIQAAIKDNLGRDLTIEGDLELSVFPWIGISTGKLILSNAAGFSDKPFAEITESELKVKLLPLLSKNIDVSRVILKGLTLNLSKNKQGVTNWDDLTKAKDAPAETTEDKQEDDIPAIAALAIGGISIEQAKIVWDDQQKNQYIEINNFNFSTGKLAFDEAIDIDLSLSIFNKQPEITEDLKLLTSLMVNEDFNQINLNKLTIESLTKGNDIPGKELAISLRADVAIDLTQQSVHISQLNLKSGVLNLPDTPIKKLAISLLADVAVDLAQQTVNISGLNLTSDDILLASAPTKTLAVSLLADVAVNLAQQTVNISGLNFTSGDIYLVDTAIKKLAISLLADVAVDITQQAVDIKGLSIKTAGLQLSSDSAPNKALDVSLLADVALNLSKQTLNIKDLTIDTEALHVSANINGTHIKDKPVFKGPIKIAPFNLAQMMQALAIPLPKMQSTSALNKASLALNLTATDHSADIKNLLIGLDTTTIKGSLNVNNFKKPAIIFSLNVDAINANHYLAPKPKKEKKPVTPAAAAVAGASLFPIKTLRALNTKGQLSIGKLTIDQVNVQGVTLKIDAKKGLIKTQQNIKKLYQGSYSGTASVNVKNKTPILNLNEKLSNVNIEPLLKGVVGEAKITGLVNAGIKVQARGNTVKAMKASLNGNANFNFKDGVVHGFNIQKIINNSKALLKGGALPVNSKHDQTVFSIIKGTATIKKGVVSNKDLYAKAGKLRVNGKGSANLARQKLDYRVEAKVLKQIATKTQAEKIKGAPIVINIGGSFDKPSYTLDIVSMLINNEKVNKVKEKLFKKLDEKLGPGVGDLLNSFF